MIRNGGKIHHLYVAYGLVHFKDGNPSTVETTPLYFMSLSGYEFMFNFYLYHDFISTQTPNLLDKSVSTVLFLSVFLT